jgi:hypothetical protein
MMAKGKKREGEAVFHPDGIRRLLEGGGENLTDDERALLLALVGAETETGRALEERERAALNALAERLEGYDAEELARAVKHMVTAESQEDLKTEWPKLERALRKQRTSKEKE